jgi:hypothetical protein
MTVSLIRARAEVVCALPCKAAELVAAVSVAGYAASIEKV